MDAALHVARTNQDAALAALPTTPILNFVLPSQPRQLREVREDNQCVSSQPDLHEWPYSSMETVAGSRISSLSWPCPMGVSNRAPRHLALPDNRLLNLMHNAASR
jgi:hypothetical protein